MDVDASCHQCGHDFNTEEILHIAATGECPVCGCGAPVEGGSGSGPFSYDPNQEFKTEP